jgi:SulP family sulfate permease
VAAPALQEIPITSLTPESALPVTSVLGALRSPRLLKTEALSGLVVALALIPEAISFSIIAGVDPRVGLFASVTMAISIAFLGGRPAMISAATGAVALLIAPVMRDHGFDYLIATVLLAGVLQVVLGLLGVARLMRFIPPSVMIGFVNSLAILIFLAQLPHLVGVPWLVYPLVAIGIAVMVMVSVGTFDWHSIRPRTPYRETTAMLVTVIVVVATHNLAIGVLAGVLVFASSNKLKSAAEDE